MSPTVSFRSVFSGMGKLLLPTLLFVIATSTLQAAMFFLLKIPFAGFSIGSIPPSKRVIIEATGLIPVFTLFFVYRKKLATGFDQLSTGKRYISTFLKAFSFALVLISACTVPIVLLNGIGLHFNAALNPLNLVFTLSFFIFAALAEEVICRVVYLGLLIAKYGEWNSLISSSLLFMVLHFLNPNVTYLAALNLFLAGILLGQIFLYKGKNLWFATIFHMGWNFTQGALFGFPVSGIIIGQTLLIQHAPPHSVWSGENFGLEGSAECTTVLILTIALLAWRRSKGTRLEVAAEPATLLHAKEPEEMIH